MWVKGKAKMNLAIASVIGVCALAITIFIVLSSRGELGKDASLITKFQNHQAQFQHLAAMANQDLRVILVRDSVVGLSEPGTPASYVYVYRDKSWPAEAQLLFSEERWREYLSMFGTLGLRSMTRKAGVRDAVFFTASVKVSELDNNEAAILEKGYVYVPGNIETDLRDSLDNIDIDRPAIFYRKLQDQWYLYYQWSISKPE